MPRSLLTALLALLTLGCTCHSDEPPAEAGSGSDREDADAFVRAALERRHVEWDGDERQAAIDAGREAMIRQQCNRCHAIDDVEPAGRSLHCTSCHRWLDGLGPEDHAYQTLSSHYGEPIVERYQRNIEHYIETPDLTGAAARLRPAWIREFIVQPFDLRPALHETMVRTTMPDADRDAIVRYFAAIAEVAEEAEVTAIERPSDERIDEGRELFVDRCGICHTFGNVETGQSAADLERRGWAAKLAPNLRFTRERLDPDVAVAWILDPRAFREDTLMPSMGLTLEEARTLRDFLWFGDPELRPTPEPPSLEPPPAVEREVTWAEVKERVLGHVCVHCHMNDYERDVGPGNQGGYGWPGSRLQMRTYETLVYGAVYGEERRSVLAPAEAGGAPPLIDAMMRRRVEEQRDHVLPFEDHERPDYSDAQPGMPMGLPSIDDDGVAIVRAWIAQGCPGPTEVTGIPGIDDGLLVPDGPIVENHGCELRTPAEDRPEWATQPPPPWHHREDREAH